VDACVVALVCVLAEPVAGRLVLLALPLLLVRTPHC